MNSVLPNLLNVAQIVNVFSNSSIDSRNQSLSIMGHDQSWPEECNPETIALHSQRIIKQVIFDPGYDRHLTPDAAGVTVSVELALQTFYDISETSASFTADVLMSQIWHDKRLRFEHLTKCVENLTLSSLITDKLWQPFVCFVNSKRSDLHQSPSPNTFVLIYPNGTVWVNYRLRIEGPCYVDLQHYPFNEEECELVMESYAYNAGNVRLKWRDWNPVLQYPSRTKLPDFVLSEIKWSKASFFYAAGAWDQLTVSFFLTRQFGVLIVQMYVPVETAVAMSWIPFFLDHRSLPARITLAVSALMSITFQYGNIIKSLPRVSYVMSVDVWVLAAVLFVAGSLVELAIVGYLHRAARIRRHARRKQRVISRADSTGGAAEIATMERRLSELRMLRRRRNSLKMRHRKSMDMVTMSSSSSSSEGEGDESRRNSSTVTFVNNTYGTFVNRKPAGSNGICGANHQLQVPQIYIEDFPPHWTESGEAELGVRKRTWNIAHPADRLNARAFQLGAHYRRLKRKWRDPARWDRAARFYFPFSFFIFNCLYWSYYLGYHKVLKPLFASSHPNSTMNEEALPV